MPRRPEADRLAAALPEPVAGLPPAAEEPAGPERSGVSDHGEPPLSLASLQRGQLARVVALAGESGLCHRLLALGLRPGQRLQVLRRAPWGGPIHVQVGMTELMLRRRDAARVAVSAAPGPR